jgi:hypothetical protein
MHVPVEQLLPFQHMKLFEADLLDSGRSEMLLPDLELPKALTRSRILFNSDKLTCSKLKWYAINH